MAFFDDLETRSSDQRLTENSASLKDILNLAANLDGYKAAFSVDLWSLLRVSKSSKNAIFFSFL